MAKSFTVIQTEQDVHQVLYRDLAYSVWARLSDRDDQPVYGHSGVRTVDGVLQINVGEWDRIKEQYINEEWVVPRFVYLIHRCDGCHYPPSMCCLSGFDPDVDMHDAWDHLFASPTVLFRIVEE